jgi:hypothetical protein
MSCENQPRALPPHANPVGAPPDCLLISKCYQNSSLAFSDIPCQLYMIEVVETDKRICLALTTVYEHAKAAKEKGMKVSRFHLQKEETFSSEMNRIVDVCKKYAIWFGSPNFEAPTYSGCTTNCGRIPRIILLDSSTTC